MDKNTNNLNDKQVIKTKSNAKPFYQYFTVYILTIFFIVVIALSSVLFFLFQQSKHSQALITEQLVPLQTLLLQQTYLINTNKLIDDILQNGNADEFISLQQQLSLQSKKLSLLKSDHKRNYQQWLSSNNLAIHIVSRIESSDTSNEVLKNQALIQLDTLLDAIKIQFNILVGKQQKNSTQAKLLSTVENELNSIAIMLKRLNLKMPLSEFEQLRDRIDVTFTTNYSKKLAEQPKSRQGMADIVRDLIRFEDLILKRGVLEKWQEHLRLMDDYQQQLVIQQQQLKNILYSSSSHSQGVYKAPINYINANQNIFKVQQLKNEVMILFALVLSGVAGLLWLIRRRMKSASQQAVTCIVRALEREKTPLIKCTDDFYSTESEQLVNKIEKIQSSNCSESEYQTLMDTNKKLEEKVLKGKATQEKLKLKYEILEQDTSVKDTSHLLIEQRRCKALNLAAIKQLVLLGNSALTTSISASNENDSSVKNNYLYQAHLQGRDLVRQLRQASCYSYLHSNDALLILNDVNLTAQIQAIVFNLRNELLRSNNSLSVSFDEKILTEVNLDAELFSEMLRVFIRLLFSNKTDRQLALNLTLVDKNKGQQKICFSGEIECADETRKLPLTLQSFNDESIEKSELGDYFNTVLRFQHGDDIHVKRTDIGYQFGFTLPLAVVNNQQGQYYPVLSLPGHLADIENICVKLAAKYLEMPIEVLLAVKIPEQYQRLQQLLQGAGLQVTFVSCEVMLQKNWQSGRFAVLMTDIDCQPFTPFMVDEGNQPSGRSTLVRGVFSLGNFTGITTKANGYSHWIVGKLSATSTVDELITVIRPWIREQKLDISLSQKVRQPNLNKEVNTGISAGNVPVSFNVEQYIKHQGSAELAIFMLDEYTVENILLVEKLSHAFMNDDAINANVAIQALLVNSKILAADYLLHLCQHWKKLLINQALDKSNKVQISLLIKTKKAVQDISHYADVVA